VKRAFTASVTAVILLGLLSISGAHAQSGCTDLTLTGSYGFSDSGFATPGPTVKGNEVPFATVGVLTFDGAGNVSVSYTTVLNGAISTNLTGSGTYTLDSGCAGSMSFTTGAAAGVTYNIVTVGGGAEVFGIATVGGATQTLDAKKL